MELPFDSVIPLLDLYPKNPESPIQRNLCTPMFIAAQFTIAKCSKQPKCPSVNKWIKKLWYIYTMEYYSAERKKELLLSCATAWMENGEYFAKCNKPVGERRIPYDLTNTRDLISKISKIMSKLETEAWKHGTD